ncbi:LAFE_0D01442g1_1 [Lachancea fermentati]|uniref:LAFE_0D01442g1_1 n=1 Tax=Lachancea fermentati TaxID=4955 RepID=A0A1G4MAN4_LACFM|nr:LAFE_0D01442g1_1 [Lachancea fermentati]
MIRRNKIRVRSTPSIQSQQDTGRSQRSKVKISSSYDDPEEEEDLELEMKLKHRKKKNLNESIISLPESKEDRGIEVSYRKSAAGTANVEDVRQDVRIMNMDDFDDGPESDLEGIPSKQDIESIKMQRTLMQQRGTSSGTGFYANSKKKSVEYDERSYVKLLNDDDKHELMETLGKKESTEDVEVNALEASLHEFDDERLALSKAEITQKDDRRREEIEKALNDKQSSEWETHQLNKVSNVGVISSMPDLDTDIWTFDEMMKNLNDLVSSTQSKKTVLNGQIKAIYKECDALEGRKQDLLMSLKSLGS